MGKKDRETEALLARIEELEAERDIVVAAVREHHDQRGDDRCVMDDTRLYFKVLGEGADPYANALPPEADMLESCRRYIRQRRCPGPEGVLPLPGDMTIAQLTERVGRLTAALESVVKFAREAHEHWDKDRDAKVGKYLTALSGWLPGYRPDTDEIHACLAEAKGTSDGNDSAR